MYNRNIFIENFCHQAKVVLNSAENIFKIIKLPTVFERKFALEHEYKKCFARASLRYNSSVGNLQKIILQSLYNKDYQKFSFTRFYPMIHLSKDESEQGSYHYDQVLLGSESTIWVAITNYDYNSLSIFKGGIFKSELINKIIIKSGIPNILSNNIKAKQGDTFSWPSHLIHKGNFNTSNSIAIAMQMQRFDPESVSGKGEVYNFDQNFPEMSNLLVDNLLLEKIFAQYIFLIDKLKKFSFLKLNFEKSLSELNFFLSDNFFKENKIISFALSVLSQRIKTMKIRKLNFIASHELNLDNFCIFLDLSSIFLGEANIESRKRLVSNKVFRNNIQSILEKFTL